VAQYYAQTDRKLRDARVDSFQELPKLDQDGNVIAGKLRFENPPDILVGTIETLGVGLTLHRGTIVILLEPQFMVTDAAQAKKRVHRLGQLYGCQLWTLRMDSIQSERLIANRAEFRQSFVAAVEAARREVEKEKEEEEEELAI
jgi:SNF2 family DNA or RNA helicase